MKKILIVSADFYPSNTGFSNATMSLVNTINEKLNWQVYIFTSTKLNQHNEYTEAKVIRFPIFFRSKFFKKITLFLRIFDYLIRTLQYIQARKSIYSVIEDNNIDLIFFETKIHIHYQTYILKR